MTFSKEKMDAISGKIMVRQLSFFLGEITPFFMEEKTITSEDKKWFKNKIEDIFYGDGLGADNK